MSALSPEERPPPFAGPAVGIVLAALAGMTALVGLLWVLCGGNWSRVRPWSLPVALVGGLFVRVIVQFLLESNPRAKEAWTRTRDPLGVNAWARSRRWFPSAMALALGCCGIVGATVLELGNAGGALAPANPSVMAVTGGLLVGAAYLERARALSRSRTGILVAGLATTAACSGGVALALMAGRAVPLDLGLASVGASVFVLLGGVACAAWCVAARRRSQ